MKYLFTISAVCLLSSLFGCQGEDIKRSPQEHAIEALQSRAQKPYSCSIQAVAPVTLGDAEETIKMDASAVFLDQESQTALLKSWLDGMYDWTARETLVIRDDGLVHALWEESPDPPAMHWVWACKPPDDDFLLLGPLEIFPSGAKNLCAQALALLSAFPSFEVTSSNSSASFDWNPVPAEFQQKFHDQNKYSMWDSQGNISSVTLTVDLEHGFPTSLRVALDNDKALEVDYQFEELSEEDYLAKSKALRSRMPVTAPMACECKDILR